MTSLTTDEMADRIVRSLKSNSVELAREQRSAANAKMRQIGLVCLVFATGLAAGVALVLAL
ncbi:MAG: hypothetical protein WDO17_00910 [Alphaproteobacteria bacterium]